MPTITVRIEGLEPLLNKLNYEAIVAGPLQEFLLSAGLEVEKESKLLAPSNLGRLHASIVTRVEETRAVIGPTVQYGGYVEFGTSPHWPNIDAIREWVRQKLRPQVLSVSILTRRPSKQLKGDARQRAINSLAFLVARRISQVGTKPQPYMRPGAEAAEPAIQGFAEAMARGIESRWPDAH